VNFLDPILIGFVLFCVNRKGREWPALYDEMCWVAGRHLYKGLGYTDLKGKGFSLGLSDINETINVVEAILAGQSNGGNLVSIVATP